MIKTKNLNDEWSLKLTLFLYFFSKIQFLTKFLSNTNLTFIDINFKDVYN